MGPLVIWRPADGRIRLANRDAAEAAGLALHELIGRSVFDLLELNPHAEVVAGAIAVGAIDSCSIGAGAGLGHRSHRSHHSRHSPRIATRALELDGSREAMTTWVPPGADGSACRSADVSPTVLGYTDREWRVTAVSSDVAGIMGGEPEACIGKDLRDLTGLGEPARSAVAWTDPDVHADLNLPGSEAGGMRRLLLAPAGDVAGPGGHVFSLIGAAEQDPVVHRLAELEQRLRRIGAEVRLAGLPDPGDAGEDPFDHTRFADLTARQWQILNGLIDGKRVPRIAGDLFLSQSTVRNHLVALFRRFGVHSQPELIEALRILRSSK